jgi:hypothetical protein
MLYEDIVPAELAIARLIISKLARVKNERSRAFLDRFQHRFALLVLIQEGPLR